MRIHSNDLSIADFHAAAFAAGVQIVDLTVHGSQSRTFAFNFTLTGSGASRSQWSRSDHQAATWDEWGIVFASLFSVDPQAHCGKNSYQSEDHFHWVTDDRFRSLLPVEQHKRHKWNPLGLVTPETLEWECKCGAIQRAPKWGMTWHEVKTTAPWSVNNYN